jgi:hypothetical protein
MSSAKVAKFLERAEHYRDLKERVLDENARQIFERMESSCRTLAASQELLEYAAWLNHPQES